MLHPATELRFVNKQIGFGVFANAFIPKGTMVYAQDALDIVVESSHDLLQDPRYKPFIEKYGYLNSKGDYIVCWDLGKYINHCCHSNILTTGFDFSIAIKDIQPGEEITDEYGLYFDREMELQCDQENCRGVLREDDIDVYYVIWDQLIIGALKEFNNVPQPIYDYLDVGLRSQLTHYLETGSGYASTITLKPKNL